MFDFPHGARVLEIGAAEADWVSIMKTLRPDLHVTCIDVREAHRPMADVTLRDNVLDRARFHPHTFDCIVAVSTIEHIGLGFYGDPIAKDGDTLTMANCRQWLAPDGWMYLDVPYRRDTDTRKQKDHSAQYRAYTDATLKSRLLDGWEVVDVMTIESQHVDGPFITLTLKVA